MTNLHTLVINNCPNLSDKHLELIGQKMKRLRYVNLRVNNHNITREGLAGLEENLTLVKRWDFETDPIIPEGLCL